MAIFLNFGFFCPSHIFQTIALTFLFWSINERTSGICLIKSYNQFRSGTIGLNYSFWPHFVRTIVHYESHEFISKDSPNRLLSNEVFSPILLEPPYNLH